MSTPTKTPRKRSAAKPAEAPYGAARIPERSQGWYRDLETQEKLRSVTTLLGQGCPKPSLVFWAANLTAQEAMENLPYLISSSLHRDQSAAAYDWLRKGHIRKKDERGDIGRAVHDIVEAMVLDTPLPESVLADREMAPYLENFLQFVKDWEVVFEASEMVVANYTDGYAGRLDYMFYSRPIAALLKVPPVTLFMGDTKTGGELDEKGVYPEAGLQMAGYRRAEYCWMRDGSKVPMPSTHSTGIVLHLRPEGYRPVPLNCGDDMFEAFLNVYKVAEFERVLSKSVVGPALVLPTASSEGEAA